MNNSNLFKVLFAIVLAVLVGSITGTEASIFGITWIRIFDLLGKLFLNALTLVVIPLVVSSIITGVSRIGSEEAVETLGLKTFSYFLFTSALAVTLGMTLAILFQPGVNQGENFLAQTIVGSDAVSQFESHAQGDTFDKLQQILYRIIPSNIFEAAAQGQILGMILFSLFFGFFATRIPSELSKVVISFWDGVFQIMMKMTHVVMRAMPFGVFGLVAKTIATTGLEAFTSVFYFFALVILGLAIHMCLVLPLLLKFIAGADPIAHFRAMTPALVTAFSVSSTAATLPVTLECAEERAGIPNRICSFTLPLGASINLQGTAVYCTIAVIFIAQVYGAVLSVNTLGIIFIMSMLSSLGMVAGIPSASIVTIVIILQTLDLPAEGIVLILAVERILDMCRTVVSVFGNSCVAKLVA